MTITARKRRHEEGSALVVTLFITTAILIGLGSYLLLVRAQYVSVVRSQAWNGALTMAESGVEEGLAQLNPGALAVNITVDRTANGWGSPAGGFYGPISRTITNNQSYSVVFSTGNWPTIYSTGYVRLPDISATLKRVIAVATTNVPLFNFALAARTNITMHGNGLSVNSFDSSSTNLSTNGRYDSSKTSTNGDVGVLYGNLDPGNHNIAGDVYLGPTASLSSTGSISGSIHSDYNYDFPDVVLPSTAGWFTLSTPPSGTINGTSYTYAFTNSGDYIIPNMSGSASVYVGSNATVRLYIQSGGVGSVLVAGNGGYTAGKLTMYVAASSFSIGGGGAVDGGRAANLAYYGLPSNTSISLSGNAAFTGTIYAPSADFTMSGGGSSSYDFVGCGIFRSITFNGHFMFHFDEALLTSGASRGYFAVSWNEL